MSTLDGAQVRNYELLSEDQTHSLICNCSSDISSLSITLHRGSQINVCMSRNSVFGFFFLLLRLAFQVNQSSE